MRKILAILSLIAFAIIPFSLLAEEAPTPFEALKTTDFYFNGEGVVLMDSKICSDIERSGQNKNECFNEIIEFSDVTDDQQVPKITHTIKKGQSVYVWMKFLVPSGAQEKIKVQYRLNGEIKRTARLKVTGSIRYRTWSKISPWREGDWEITIFLDKEEAPVELKTFTLTVNS